MQATPIEVREYYWRCILMEREIAADKAAARERAAGDEPGAIRVAR